MKGRIFASFIVVSIAVAPQPSLASGTSGGGSGNLGDAYPTAPRDPQAEAYSRGKSLVSRKIACKKCENPDGVKDTPTALKVAARVRAGEFMLKPHEQEQVLYYLSRRFGA